MSFVINSKRLTIRQFKIHDLEKFISFMTEPESTKFLTFNDAQKTRAGATELLQATINSYSTDNPMMAFAVENNENKEFIGFCGLTPREDNDIEIMFAIMPNARGKGYATEVARELSIHALNQLGYDRVLAPISIEHETSKAVVKKAGFKDHGYHQGFDSAEKIHLFVYEKNNN